MKILRIALIFAVTLFVLNCLTASAGEVKIGYVNLGKAFDEYERTKESDASLGKKGELKEKEREKMVEEIKTLKDEMVLLSDKGKKEKEELIDEKIKNLQEFDRVARDELKQERDEMVREILSEIDKVIQGYGKKNGYTVILNNRVLVYGDETIDITREIIEILNK